MNIKMWMPLAAALMLVACANTRPDKAAKPEPTVATATTQDAQTRAQQRWDLLIAGKMSQAYDYLSPGYRQLKDRQTYAQDMSNRPVHWTKAEVKASECPPGESFCDVTVNIHYKMRSPLPGVGDFASYSPVRERWIQTEGSWYFVPKEVTRK